MKNKIFLTALIALNSCMNFGAVAPVLRKTIPQRIVAAWQNLDEDTRKTAVQFGVSVAICAVCMRLQESMLSPAHFKIIQPNELTTTFDDVIGLEDVKQQMKRYINFNKDREKYDAIGAHPVTGVIAYGLPGTGKNEIMRAFAKEAGLPIIVTTGSDFNGPLRGSGTQQVRALMEEAEKHAPCIVFVDEIDSVIGKPGIAHSTSTDDQATTNKWKTVLDGFGQNKKGIFLTGATNHLSHIDPAILRDGRLVPIEVSAPSVDDVAAIFERKLYGGTVKAEPNIDIRAVVNHVYRSGYTGANVAAAVNDAANIAVEAGKLTVDQESLNQAVGMKSLLSAGSTRDTATGLWAIAQFARNLGSMAPFN